MAQEGLKELLFSFFTRENPDGDSWVYEGFGPMRRRVLKRSPKDSNGKWNFAYGHVIEKTDGMPNPDTFIDTFVAPFESTAFDLVQRVSALKNGAKWLETCEKYLSGWGKKMPEKMPFEILPFEMPPSLWYVEETGEYIPGQIGCEGDDDLFKLDFLPEGMIHGTFHPALFDVPYCPISNEKIGMRCNGGAITKGNARDGYTAQTSVCQIYISMPWNHQLIGEWKGKTHFIEYVFARHCKEEKNPCPAIRIELKPEKPEMATLAREKQWEKDRDSQERKAYSCFL